MCTYYEMLAAAQFKTFGVTVNGLHIGLHSVWEKKYRLGQVLLIA